MNIFAQVTGIHHAERSAVGWAFAYFFCLLCGYYILRPVRDEMGIQGGVENLQWVFTGTFLVMLAAVPAFGTVVARIPRARLIPVVYGFFIANIFVFYLFFEATDNSRPIAVAFFIWTSVFNLFVVSVFWSFMADIFSNPQAKRLFGIIAAGGSAGALAGPSLTIGVVDLVGLPNLLLCSVAFLMGALVCVFRLNAWQQTQGAKCDPAVAEGRGSLTAAIGGGAFAGFFHVLRSPFLMGIGAYIIFSTTVATFLYFTQAYVVRDTWSDPTQRTTFFAVLDLCVNALTVLLQLFVTGQFIRRFGMTVVLILLPLLMVVGCFALGWLPILVVLATVQVLRRVVNYALARPAREVLYTLVTREDKYKAKNFNDTVVYRGGDALSGWLYAGLGAVGMGLSAILFAATPVALIWFGIGWWLGHRHDVLAVPGNRPRAAALNTQP